MIQKSGKYLSILQMERKVSRIRVARRIIAYNKLIVRRHSSYTWSMYVRVCKGAVQSRRASGWLALTAANYRSLINPVNWGSHEKSVIALRHASEILISSRTLGDAAQRFNAISQSDTRAVRDDIS